MAGYYDFSNPYNDDEYDWGGYDLDDDEYDWGGWDLGQDDYDDWNGFIII